MNDPFLRFGSANPSFGSLRSKISIAARAVAQVKLEVSDTDSLPKSYHSSAYFENENGIKTRFWLGKFVFSTFSMGKRWRNRFNHCLLFLLIVGFIGGRYSVTSLVKRTILINDCRSNPGADQAALPIKLKHKDEVEIAARVLL